MYETLALVPRWNKGEITMVGSPPWDVDEAHLAAIVQRREKRKVSTLSWPAFSMSIFKGGSLFSFMSLLLCLFVSFLYGVVSVFLFLFVLLSYTLSLVFFLFFL